ncbi:molybdate ABC transporter substrate-binding protein [Effusibacillus dendaii]|uniref:Molybdate ABC transporter substrate-binding protein n=1 Tax=Effusibacillus dendaii TaxID=2743772 RepID=A0A7I8DC37_9BACL|nr:molybdate ABC transporter substrate-binding protein [Effusibacillus dendaii]BCJ87654.1 molybdate ABC transporter substrate-binding protein [Effusibacillus dendaii]
MKKSLAWLVSFLCVVLVGCGATANSSQPQKTITVACDSSLESIVRHLAWTYESNHPGVKVQLTSGASGELVKQIEQTGSFDLFLTAGENEMQQLVGKNLVEPSAVKRFLGNQLVVIVPQGNLLLKNLDQLKDPKYKKITIGDPATVPAGLYAKQSLEKAGVWKDIESKILYASTDKNALAYVAEGRAADVGLVFKSDVVDDDNVYSGLQVDPRLHDPIRYPMAVLKSSKTPDVANDFLKSLQSPDALSRFQMAAFDVNP